jgi:microcystin-dependent protein
VDFYIALIFQFGGNFAPSGSFFCHGQLVSISEYTALFALVGTTYGGDGVTTFALPDLRGRVPVHLGQGPGLANRQIGEQSGQETATLTLNQLPSHAHPAVLQLPAATATASGFVAGSGLLPGQTEEELYATTSNATAATQTLTLAASSSGNQPFDIMQPYLALSYCIQMEGIFPSRS